MAARRQNLPLARPPHLLISHMHVSTHRPVPVPVPVPEWYPTGPGPVYRPPVPGPVPVSNREVSARALVRSQYGALQGKDKKETVMQFGEDQVKQWRRSYDIPPPPVEPNSEYDPRIDPLYSQIDPEALPSCECTPSQGGSSS